MSGIQVAFFGMLSRPAEVKTSKGGRQYIRANLRVDDSGVVMWINAAIFDNEAIAVADKMVQGVRLYIEGKLSTEEWTDRDGTKRQSLSVMAWHCRLPHIGRNKPKRAKQPKAVAPNAAASIIPDPDLNDAIPDLGGCHE